MFSKSEYIYTHIRTHTYTCTHIYTHTHIHIDTHTRIHTHKYTHVHIHTHTHTYSQTVLVYTDSRITLQSLQNHKRHTHLIDQIRNTVLDMERNEWKVEFSWIKAHVGQRGNELADRLGKEASRNKNIEEC